MHNGICMHACLSAPGPWRVYCEGLASFERSRTSAAVSLMGRLKTVNFCMALCAQGHLIDA